ncbi:MAG: hypothetical protein E6Q97_36970 [Desulfurellales bacterium]|nr:MAG: hypothetical protein E6Q97_36970 [Desulfurellales bacterium]
MSKEIQRAATATVTKPVKMADFVGLFNNYRLQIAQIAPKKGLQAERMIALAAQVFASAKPAYEGAKTIRDCSPQSIVSAVMQCSMLGLSPIPQRGECYFVPYGSDVQMQIGYQGWILLAYKSGAIASLTTACVYEGDEFTPILGSDGRIDHKPGPNYGDPQKVTWAYAIATLRGGGEVFSLLSKPMIERLRMKSPMQSKGVKGAWATDYDKMAQAKAIKQVLKLVPREDEWRAADFVDESIATIDRLQDDGGEFTYPQEGSAEVMDDEPETTTEPIQLTGAQIAQMEAAEKAARKQGGGNGELPLNP